MKANNIANIVIGLCALSVLSLSAQPFSSGSDGSYGPLNVTSNIVLDLPPDGKFNCTTIDVAPNVTLSFRRNALNTPVYLLATSNVIINGVIDVSGMSGDLGFGGAGGPGGFDGGQPSNGPGTLPGDGLGPGAGRGDNTYAGSGSYGSTRSITNSLDGATYGNTLILPLIGGSGGGGGQAGLGYYGGGGGGGAILIASDTSVNIGAAGAIVARGGAAKQQGFGSGGAVRVVAPVVEGTGLVDVRDAASGYNSYAGVGRIRVDATNRYSLFLSGVGSYTIGKYMHVFPTSPSRLDIVGAAGMAIAEGTPAPVRVQLPLDAPTNQVVKVQARDFTGIVPITLAVTPDAGPSARYDIQIDMSGGNPAQTNVNVVIPAGTTCRIYAWTR